jgi:transcriptional regulator with XRE-family HTH domain
LGKRLHELRAAKKWSQEEFAHVSGLHRTYIGQIERGEKNISFDNLSKVAGALGLTLSDLFSGLEDGAPPSQVEARTAGIRAGRTPEDPHRTLEFQRLAKRLRLQGEAINQTIQALDGLAAGGSSKRTAPRGKTNRRSRVS